MKVTFITADGVALVNGRAIHIDLSDFPPTIHAVQWNGIAGHIEYNDGTGNLAIDSLAAFQPWIDRWEAARSVADSPPPPPPPPTSEKLAELAERAAIAAMRADQKATAMFSTLKAATSIEIDAWIDSNFTAMTIAQRKLIKLLTAVAALYLRER